MPTEPLEPRIAMSVSFAPIETYQTPQKPLYFAVGDFNNDARDDIATSITQEDVVSVLLNNGDGTFPDRPSLNVASPNPRAIVAADFDGNGADDIAVTQKGGDDQGVNVYLANGDGTFAPRTRTRFDNSGRALAAGDVNGDSRPDLFASTSKRVAVLLNNGDGTFADPVRYDSGGAQARSIRVADLNNDGLGDLVVAVTSRDSISTLLNTGGGTFGAPTRLKFGLSPLESAVGDYNGDGTPDLAVANWGFRINGLSVLLGQGNGTFGPRTPYKTDSFSETVLSGDFDGDGTDEVIVGPATGDLQVFKPNPDGTVTKVGAFKASPTPPRGTDQILTGELNGDGKLDLVSLIYRRAKVGILLNTSTP